MEFIKSYKKSSIWLLILNFLFVFFFDILLLGVHGGGTDDISEGTSMNLIYLLLKGFIAFCISIIALIWGVIKKEIKATIFFWLPYSIILIISSFLIAAIPGDTLRSTGIISPTRLETNISILAIIIDSFITLMFSFILSILTLLRKDKVSYISLPLNVVVLFIYILIFLDMKTEIFF